ncbi:VPA1269 family protein [Paeniroseomonas aquatica]
MSLDDILTLPSQNSVVDIEAIEKAFAECRDADDVMRHLAAMLWDFDRLQDTMALGGRGAGLHYAAPWFLMYLAREDYILFPRLIYPDSLLPRFVAPLLWTFFMPKAARNLALHLVKHPGEDQWTYTRPVLRELFLYTNFFRLETSTIAFAHFVNFKREYTLSETGAEVVREGAGVLSHGLNRLFDAYLNFHGKTWEDVGSDARYFGGGYRITSDNSRDAFSWVEQPKGHKLVLYRKHIGEPPETFPGHIQEWARDLRAILLLYGVQSPANKIDSLNYWLIFLMKLGDDAPRNWCEVERERHINHVGLAVHLTFVDFIRSLDRDTRFRILPDIQQAWHLAAVRDGFLGKLTNPIDPNVDNLGFTDPNSGENRTRRQAMPDDLYQLVIRENRRNNYEFAKSTVSKAGARPARNIHWRSVNDPSTKQRVEVFWPGIPIMLDMILSQGLRQASAMWADSGEGDEFWVNTETLEYYPNPLPMRTLGRQLGFLRVCQLGPKKDDKVLGMYVAVNKTGPYEVAWVDPATATAYQEMRAWQARYTPRRTPTKASRDDIQKLYAGQGTIPEVYPLFRDPESRSGHPPSSTTLYAYWGTLLGHCEKIFEQTTGRFESCLVNGKPRWDLHSLRVTTISILLEHGVEPWIVAELAGHASVTMTWRYKARDGRKTHAALQKIHEERRLLAIQKLQELGDHFIENEDDLDVRLKDILGPFVKFREDNNGETLLRQQMTEGGRYETYAHGLCPGGDCATGGVIYKNAYQPVFRPRACSQCRHRVTGPQFLAGLVNRLNSFMIEIKSSMDTEADLNRQIEEIEDQGKGGGGKVVALGALIRRERELRDNLWGEWCAELATIRQCEKEQDSASKGSNMPLITRQSGEDFKLHLDTVHQMALLHNVLTDSDIILGASLEVPAGLRERRDTLLLEVARNNDLAPVFYKLAPSRRKKALQHFGDLLLGHIDGVSELQQLIDGDLTTRELPALEVELEEFVAAVERDSAHQLDQIKPVALRGRAD